VTDLRAGHEQDGPVRHAGERRHPEPDARRTQAGLECAFGILVEVEGSDRLACVIETVVIYR
jgi:hypothetical protein